jgi:thiol-disulfide isomerase/thioredoxin
VRVVPCILVIAWLSLGTTGCSLFQKKPKDPDTAKSGGKEPARFPTGGGDPIRGNSASAGQAGDGTTILAGTLLDEHNNRPKEAYISWVALDEKTKDGAPVDVAAMSDGSFLIRGVKTNQHYKLMARAKEGSRMIAGVSYAQAPSTHVLIVLKASLATADTPPLPPAPAYTPKPQEEPKKTSARPAEPQAFAQNPAWPPGNTNAASAGNSRPAAVPDLPSAVSIPTPAPTTKPAPTAPSGGWMPGIAQEGAPRADLMQIPNQTAPPPVKMEPPVSVSVPPLTTATRVPSCVLVPRNRVINFALYDLQKQPWVYRTERRGKLLLLDFWGTWCGYCKPAIPQLVALQSKYGSTGLEIIGLAYEQPGTFAEQSRRVSAFCQAQQINYRMLMGGGDQCPVRAELGVQGLPSLFLIDENGWIIWHHEGYADRGKFDALEELIKHRLRIRP